MNPDNPVAHGARQPASTQVWWAPLTLADVRLLDLLHPDEVVRVERATQAADRARRLLGAAVLRCAVGHRFGVDPHGVRIDRTCPDCGAQHGPPRLPDHDVFASVSHSGLLSVVALSDRPVGIDVQRDADLNPSGSQPGVEVTSWVRAEAILKSGLGDAAVVIALHPPVDGHTAAVATATGGAVDELDAHRLLG